MGRSKRKNKLQLRPTSETITNSFSNLNKNSDDKYSDDEPTSENLETIINNPLLLNHINDIQNVNENILVWNNEDVIDNDENAKMYENVKNEVIVDSIRNSPFSNFLKAQLKDINKLNPAALTGVIMKSYNNSTCASKENMIEILNDTRMKPNKSTNLLDSESFIIDQENNTEYADDESPQKDSMKDSMNSKQSDVSPTPPVRRSGRSVKINYLELLNIPIYENRKVSETETVSPNRRVSSRRSVSKPSVKLLLKENSDNQSPTKESQNVISTNLQHSVIEPIINNDEAIHSDLKEQKLITPETNGTNFTKDEIQPIILSKYNLQESQEDIENLVLRSRIEETVIDEDNKTLDNQNLLSDVDECSVHDDIMELNQKDELCPKDAKVVRNKRRTSSRRNIRNKSKIKKSVVKEINKSCIMCSETRLSNRNFLNLCSKCGLIAKQVIKKLKIKDNFVCIDDPPCWSKLNDEFRCCACTIQRFLECGLKMGIEFKYLESMSVEELRNPEYVTQIRSSIETEMEKSLESWSDLPSNASCRSCILTMKESELKHYKWDITVFSKEVNDNVATCALCKSTDTLLYLILPEKKYHACDQCLLTAHVAYNNHSNQTVESCHPSCIIEKKCPQCILAHLQSLCPLEAIKYRYFNSTDTSICELCMRQDSSLISKLPSGNFVCLICICRIKIGFCKKINSCLFDQCSIVNCAFCLKQLASKVVDLHQIITYFYEPLQNVSKKSIKRPGDNEYIEQKLKRPRTTNNSLIINANWSTPDNTGDNRRKRIIKSSHYDDYIVDDRCLLHSTNNRQVKTTYGYESKNEKKDLESSSVRKRGGTIKKSDIENVENTQDLLTNAGIDIKPDLLSEAIPNNKIFEDENKDNNCIKSENQNEIAIEENAKNDSDTIDDKNEVEVKCDSSVEDKGEDEDKLSLKEHGDLTNEETPKANRRIKQAFPGESISPIVSRASGPRVKQVSRQNVNVDLNLDTVRQKCVVKRVNRIAKDSNKPNDASENFQEQLEVPVDEKKSNESGTGLESFIPRLPNNDFKCGSCASCLRNRSCGKCDSCLLNKSQRRKTEICHKMVCVRSESNEINDEIDVRNGEQLNLSIDSSQKKNGINTRNQKISSQVYEQQNYNSIDNADRSIDETFLPTVKNSNVNVENVNGITNTIEVYRDSDSDDLSSEEEQLDPDLDNIHIVKGDMITTALAHEGGFPVITSFKSQPNKVLCFSCGSGGDQMIHCVSCAEPFHFFCIEYQFRPKSKEMFVCRNCTKCYACQGYGSDLKCIKCQLGFHPACVDKYPPSRSEDKSNWACYKCAMCLHCGAKAEDAMEHIGKNTYTIDWCKDDPWQCGNCARARKAGHVCPECGRAYQTGLETIECYTCSRMVHRQCSGLTEDDYEILKCEPLSLDQSNSFKCSKCINTGIDEESKKRVRLKRQCKESGLKNYCEHAVTRRTSEYIQRGETREEELLEQYNISDTNSCCRSSLTLNQVDGADDELEKIRSYEKNKELDFLQMSSPVFENCERDMNQTNSTICNSSESIEEYDMEQLSTLDMEPSSKVDLDCDPDQPSLTRTKTGIFSRLNALDFMSPKHMLIEIVARINIKLSRYPTHSHICTIYKKLMIYLQDLCGEIFPWIDFSSCVDTAHNIVKKNSGRMKLVLQTIYDNVREFKNREFDVFSASILEIEEKLSNSFQKGRDEFIIYHSEQHLTALMKNLEMRSPDSVQFTKYRLAFEMEDKSHTICEKDIRKCALCSYSGDDGLEGRLIYGGLDVWVHVNCALWSDEVYEREDGALVNVAAAIKRGESTVCSSCNNLGATVRCSAEDALDGYGKGCSNVYHFGCAFNLLTDPVFTESRTFFCSEMHETHSNEEQQLGLADMLILRRIYLPQGSLVNVSLACPNGLPSTDVVVTIGNLRIDCLGKIESCSDFHKIWLCPIGYTARRLYWSMCELDSLVMYFMSVNKELNLNISAEDGVSISSFNNTTPPPVVRRRRMIGTTDSRVMKRSKLMDCKHDIVYEMDEIGNLQPIAGTSSRFIPQNFHSTCIQESKDTKKVNRRFPINKTNRIDLQSVELPNSTKIRDPKLVIVDDISKSTTNNLPMVNNNAYAVHLVQSSQMNKPLSSSQQFITTGTPISLVTNHGTAQKGQQYLYRTPVTSHTISNFVSNGDQVSLNASRNMQIINSNTPRVLKINKINNVKQGLPQMLNKPLNIISKPLTFVNVPRSGYSGASNIIQATTGVSNSTYRNSQRILKITKLPTSIIIPSSTQQSNQPIRLTSAPIRAESPSVLRTVLTDTSHHLSKRRLISESPYSISSCGSLSSLQGPQLSQYDGEADDCLIMTDNHMSGAGSVCSDQENMSIATSNAKPKQTYRPRQVSNSKYCLRFTIHGFKTSKSPKTAWTYLVRRIAQLRKGQGLGDYTLRTGDGWAKFGIEHRHVVYLVEQMVNSFQCTNYEFKFHKNRVNKLREQYAADVQSENGCARFTPWFKTKADHIARDPLAFLHCKSNHPPKNYAPEDVDENEDNPEPDEYYLERLATQFRHLHNGVRSREKNVRVCCSVIHGRGLFARREFEAHEVIIEYVGEIIRSILSDVREIEYQKTGVDCYMFRLDQEYIVDATFKGNAARFINHSCHPNCYAKVVRFEGEKHIIIIAQRQIYKGEELTYDYRFPIEDDKLPCTCGSFSCKKYLN